MHHKLPCYCSFLFDKMMTFQHQVPLFRSFKLQMRTHNARFIGIKKGPVQMDINFEDLGKFRTKCISNTLDHQDVYNSL